MSNLDNLRLASSEDDEDLYSGFNESNPLYDTNNLAEDEGFIKAVQTSHGRRPPMTALKGKPGIGRAMGTGYGKSGMTSGYGKPSMGTGYGKSPLATGSLNRAQIGTAMGRGVDGEVGPRPMTAVTGAGFSAAAKRGPFDPLNQAATGIAGAGAGMEGLDEVTPEDKIKGMERTIGGLIDASAIANSQGDYTTATAKAREAGKKERQLVRQRETAGLSDGISVDLTYSVLFNLAVQYEANEMYTEALNSYTVIVKNKMFQNAGRIKVNMGNIFYKQGQYSKATKYYRMALDQVPNTHKEVRIRIMQNIGTTFLKLGQYNDAITSYEHIMAEQPDFISGLNLILCYFTVGDREKLMKTFQKMLTVSLGIDDEDKYTGSADNAQESVFLDAIRNDSLRQLERKRKRIGEYCIMTAAKVIAPAIDETFQKGFDWCIEQVKMSQHHELSNDLEIHKAIVYLREQDFSQAVSILKTFEKKDTHVKSQAAANLSFIYLLQGNIDHARRYAEASVKADRFNSPSLTNKANCMALSGQIDDAVMLYREALDNDSSCYEALYNLGLIYKRRGNLDEALTCFLKLHNIVTNSAEVMYQIGSLYDQMEDWAQAVEWMLQAITIAPTDASVLSKLADMYERADGGDRSQAFTYRMDSYRLFPADIDTVEWLGSYYIDSQYSEKAIEYFERAAVIQPKEVKWRLMVASCYRRSGNYQAAFDKYKHINQTFPENVECLKYLNRLCADMGLNAELQEYAVKLKKAEKANEARSRNDPAFKSKHDGGSSEDSGGVDSAGARRQRRHVPAVDGSGYGQQSPRTIDASYSDPLGPAVARPKTAAARGMNDEFDDVVVDDNMLPD